MKRIRVLIPILTVCISVGLVAVLIVHFATTVIIEQHTYQLTAVFDHPAAPNQAQARIISVASLPQSGILYASGLIPINHASGMLVFLNNTNHSITLTSSIFVGRSRIPVSFHGPVVIPAVPPDVIIVGFAMQPGPVDVPVFDIDQMCCASGIVVKNTTSFSLNPTFPEGDSIQQSGIDYVTDPWSIWLQKNLLIQIKGQIKGMERVVDDTLHCQQSVVTSAHPVHTVVFAIQDICSEIVYDYQTVQVQAEALFRSQVAQGLAHSLLGPTTIRILHASLNSSRRQINLSVLVKGSLRYDASLNCKR